MILAPQEISEITRSNIVNLFPEYDSGYEYIAEPLGSSTFRSTVRVGNYLYHSTANNNLGNYPLDTLTTFWSKGDVSNIYAMLDFENITQTEWEGDGVVEFKRGLMTILALGGLISGCVKVEMLEPKHGVLSGLVLSHDSGNYQLNRGDWYADSEYIQQNIEYIFTNSVLTSDSDNYLYPKYTSTSGYVQNPLGIAMNGDIAFITSNLTSSVTAVDMSDPVNPRELGVIISASLNGAYGIAVGGSTAYVASLHGLGSGAVTSIDISSPSAMTELDSITSTGLVGATGVAISGSTVYAVSFTSDMVTSINVANPSSMAVLDELASANFDDSYFIAISGNTAYVSSGGTDMINAVNITNPSSMALLSSFTSVNIDNPKGIAIDGNTAYVASVHTDSIVSLNISNPASIAELDSFTSVNLDGAHDVVVSGSTAYVACFYGFVTSVDITSPSAMTELDSTASTNFNGLRNVVLNGSFIHAVSNSASIVTSIDISNPSDLASVSSFPDKVTSATIGVISVAHSDPQPPDPIGDIATWMVKTDGSNNFVSMTDVREFINDDPIDSLTQIKTFYNEGKGAGYFVLPELGDIVRVTLLEANGAGTACGTMIAGKGVDLGQTLSKPSFSQVPALRGYVKEANITTIVDDRDITLVANEANKAIDEWSLFVVDPSESSNYQHILMLAQMREPAHEIASSTKQHLKLRIQGDELINEIPLGVYDVAYFIAGVTEVLEVYKGCGNMNFTRPVTATYIDKYGNTKTAAINEPRFQDGMLMSGGGEVCWYDAVESIPTFENGFTFEWQGKATRLSTNNQVETYIMSNDNIKLYFKGMNIYFYLNGDTISAPLPDVYEIMKIEIRATVEGRVAIVMDDVELTNSIMDITDMTTSLTYIGSHDGVANSSEVLLQTASHKWYNFTLDGELGSLYPSNTLYPSDELYPS